MKSRGPRALRAHQRALFACLLVGVFQCSCSNVLGIDELELSANRTSYYEWQLTEQADGFYDLDAEVHPRNDPDPSHYGIFFAHQFSLAGGSSGFIGLQKDSRGKRALFSIWDASGVIGAQANLDACQGQMPCAGKFQQEDGQGYQAMVPLEWRAGARYRMSVRQRAVGNQISWEGSIADESPGGARTVIGSILVPSTWRRLRGNSTTFIDYYGRDGHECDNRAPPIVDFSPPLADDGSERALLMGEGAALCPPKQ